MAESNDQPHRHVPRHLRRVCIVSLVVSLMLASTLIATSRRQKPIAWIPYSSAALAQNEFDGKSSAILFYGRWTLSADPKGGLVTPMISQSLVDAEFDTMEVDLTNSTVEGLHELKRHGIAALPALVLYNSTGTRLIFDGGTAESEIVATLERIGQPH